MQYKLGILHTHGECDTFCTMGKVYTWGKGERFIPWSKWVEIINYLFAKY